MRWTDDDHWMSPGNTGTFEAFREQVDDGTVKGVVLGAFGGLVAGAIISTVLHVSPLLSLAVVFFTIAGMMGVGGFLAAAARRDHLETDEGDDLPLMQQRAEEAREAFSRQVEEHLPVSAGTDSRHAR